jgi:DNA repair protein RadC
MFHQKFLAMKNLFLSNVAEVQLTYITKVKATDRPQITRSNDAEEILRNYWDHTIEHTETVVLMLLNRANRILGITTLSKGGTTGCIVDVKVVFQYALKANASSVILAHSHPSGNLKASQADINITKKVKEAGEFLDIKLLDHIILTPYDGYLSMADEGIL